MNIQLWSKIKNSSVPVLFLKNKGKAKEHHFFKLLSEGDKNYIGRFLNKKSCSKNIQIFVDLKYEQ